MTGELVLVTGATGHIGFRVLVDLLKAGYTARVVVRSEDKAKTVLEAPSIKALNPGSAVSFVTVPDITADGAYDEAAKGVQYVIHIASPLIKSDSLDSAQLEDYYIAPAVKGSIGMLESARKAGTVKRVVITSSLVAIGPFSALVQYDGTVYDAESRTPTPANGPTNDMEGYCASKVAAFNAAEEWIKKEQPAFDVVHVHPAYVLGRHELNTTAPSVLGGTNRMALAPILGTEMPFPVTSGSVHLDDVSRVHVGALNPKIAGGQSFVVSRASRWEDVFDIVKTQYSEALEKGTLPNNGAVTTLALDVDVSKTEKTFGFEHKKFQEQVVSVLDHYLELAARG